MLTKGIFQIVADTLRQFALDEKDGYLPYFGHDEVFMRKAHKINLSSGSSVPHSRSPSRGNNFILIDSEDNKQKMVTQPSTQWATNHDQSLDTFNLSPKSVSPDISRIQVVSSNKDGQKIDQLEEKLEDLERQYFEAKFMNESLQKMVDSQLEEIAHLKSNEEVFVIDLKEKQKQV